MTEEMLDGMFVLMMVFFLAGELLGIMVCAICAGWYDKIMKEKAKRKGRRCGNISGRKDN